MMPGSSSTAGASSREQLLARAHQAYVTGITVNAREPHLAGVLRDTLATPGNLTRLQLGLIAGAALDLPAAATRPLASALEYFHTASLLLDDLPCMDDAHLRRGRPCPHVVHGEGATILGALGFINRGYRLVWDALAAVPEMHRAATAAHVERCLGTAGVLDGQSLDLHFTATDRTPRTVARIALGKTVSLLRLSLVTPALLAGAGARERLLIDRVSVAWGLAYQIADDFGPAAIGFDEAYGAAAQYGAGIEGEPARAWDDAGKVYANTQVALARLGEGRPWLTAGTTPHRLLADIAEGYDAVVLGADKWHQLLDPDWYGGRAERDDALRRLPTVALAARPPWPLPGSGRIEEVRPGVRSGAGRAGAATGASSTRATPVRRARAAIRPRRSPRSWTGAACSR